MTSLISNKELTIKLESCLPYATKVNIISAFITKPAYRWLSELTKFNLPEVALVGRFLPKDFIDGASNIEAIRESLLSGYSVKALSNLHAKIYQIDNDLIFTGSANMTGKGLALIEECNLEACAKVAPSDESKAFIDKIINTSVKLTLERLDKMQAFIDELNFSTEPEVPDNWPEDIMPKIKDIFVSDFPLAKPGEPCEIYQINPSLDFAIIESNNTNFDDAQSLFKNSKAYHWLKTTVVKHQGDRNLGFGQISRMLHDALADDPAPYRRDIKDIQVNMYEYIRLYAPDEIEIYVPGSRSEVIRIIK
ncbi:hypothetical protein GCM10009111_03690 [Colwellia asteriadis]|uniref:PLD phosphodiesterase domain-containing protein n=1 Tax=Colwellia asteriadis TaxID=517723 RepID=A0ABN1L2Z4_9GAMM